jgi:hypothetical protein
MIQRLQTLFLVLILVIVALLCMLPVYNITIINEEQAFVTFRKLQQLKILSLSIAIIPLLALVAIFMFKNRQRQLKLVYTGMFLSLILFVLCISMPKVFSSAYLITLGTPQVDYNVGIFLIAIIPALFFFAAKYIRKDEKITKDADRLR